MRVVCARAYHALFMHNLLIRPSREELEDFGEPDLVIFNAGDECADRRIEGVTSSTSVMLNLERREMVLLGTNYAGEMKKGVFTAMNYWMPQSGILSMHCSANQGARGDTTLFFGLSGTGKTTLSSDPRRRLIGDDEHCWSGKRDLQYRRRLLRQVPGALRRTKNRKSTEQSGSAPCLRMWCTTHSHGCPTITIARLLKTPARATRSNTLTTRLCPAWAGIRKTSFF